MYLKASHLTGNVSQKDRADRQSIRPDVKKTRGLETLSGISKFALQRGSGDSVEQPTPDVRHSPLWCRGKLLSFACGLPRLLTRRQSELLSLYLLPSRMVNATL